MPLLLTFSVSFAAFGRSWRWNAHTIVNKRQWGLTMTSNVPSANLPLGGNAIGSRSQNNLTVISSDPFSMELSHQQTINIAILAVAIAVVVIFFLVLFPKKH
jgi:hypothetical protein